MPKKPTGKAFHTVQVRVGMSIKGGLSRQTHNLEVAEYDYQGVLVKCTPISSQLTWLCSVCADSCPSRRPLGRCSVFRLLQRQFIGSGESNGESVVTDSDDRMAALGFDDDAPKPIVPSLEAARKTTNRKATTFALPVVAEVEVPASPSVVTDKRKVIVVMRGKKMFIEVDALSWLVNFVREEVDNGGVKPIASDPAPKPSILWDWRDEAWFLKSTADGGGRTRSSMSIRRRLATDLSRLTFQEARQYVYDEFARSVGLVEGSPRSRDSLATHPADAF